MSYNLVYESSVFEFNFLLSIIIFSGILIIVYYTFYKNSLQKNLKIASLIIIFFLFLEEYEMYNSFKTSKEIQKNIMLKQYHVVEGKIENFHIMPKSGHQLEHFTVANQYFEISYTGNFPSDKTLYYTLTKLRKGPIVENTQMVKIYYLVVDGKNKIIKMWIK